MYRLILRAYLIIFSFTYISCLKLWFCRLRELSKFRSTIYDPFRHSTNRLTLQVDHFLPKGSSTAFRVVRPLLPDLKFALFPCPPAVIFGILIVWEGMTCAITFTSTFFIHLVFLILKIPIHTCASPKFDHR